MSEKQKNERVVAMKEWEHAGDHLHGRILIFMNRLRDAPSDSDPLSASILSWLYDADDYYVVAARLRRGVVGAIGNRPLWRIRHLLRTPDHCEPDHCEPLMNARHPHDQ
jgi:hypothetical protein